MRPPPTRALATLAALACLTGCGDAAAEPTALGELVPAAERLDAPDLAGELLGGGELDPASLSGRVTVLTFWGSWCAPCRVEMPAIDRVAEDLAPTGVSVLGVNVQDPERAAMAFVAEQDIGFPSVADPRGEVSVAFAAFPISKPPSTVLIDAEGRVAAVYAQATTEEQLRRALGDLLAEG
ncbi:TlpA family protein disulfide reductase [Goekera deserti]|uniref:TlpA family protein disulfide reductase n=1 Tax=Goekera deserti TaxID=2497753 RepID=A0A7K3W9X0_9ACTN|nr:TlpA disulfide reductase family protein [Goekera deserti]NDI47441.1 redoxin domain-containing protein [Goekera deserti]NEL53252.1 TlpA family protein disulfide reductase [Goekera deserti]